MEMVRILYLKHIQFDTLTSFVCLCHTTVSVDCPVLANPANGLVTVNDETNIEGTTATYSCINGFDLTGNEMRTCQNVGGTGVWSGSDPTCERKQTTMNTV